MVLRTDVIEFVAEVRPAGDTVLVATEIGKVTMIIGEGDTVRSGSVVARIQVKRVRDAGAPADLRRAEADLASLRRELVRSRRLLEEGGISRLEFEKAGATVDAAAVTVEVMRDATKNRSAAEGELRAISAPFDALVLEKQVEIGDAVTRGARLLRVADVSSLEIAAAVGQADISGIFPGDSVQILFEELPGETHVASVARIDRTLTEDAMTTEVVVVIPNPGLRIPAGILARMRIDRAGNRRGR